MLIVLLSFTDFVTSVIFVESAVGVLYGLKIFGVVSCTSVYLDFPPVINFVKDQMKINDFFVVRC